MLAYCEYMERQIEQGHQLNHMTRHILGFFQGQNGAKRFRRHISENAHRAGAKIDVVYEAIDMVEEHS